jgi:hypothetical protein
MAAIDLGGLNKVSGVSVSFGESGVTPLIDNNIA